VNLAVAAALFLLPWAVALVKVLRHQHLDSGAVGLVATVSLGLPALWLAVAAYWVAQSGADKTAGPSLAKVAEGLAGRLRSQWTDEAKVRELNDPYPLPVTWTAADPPLAGDLDALKTLAIRGAGWPRRAQKRWATGPEDLVGGGDRKLADVLAAVPTGRLVVLGEPGSGKTMLMVGLVLDLLARRSSDGPVPVLASLASWDPVGQDLHGWLGATLITDYPDLAATPPPGSAGSNRFEALVEAGLILPVLDGLDEITESVRPRAIARINNELQPGEQVVVTCRTKQYQAAVSLQDGQGAALRAAAVQLSPLIFDQVASYLREDAGPAGVGRWDFLDGLSLGSPVRTALAMPLMAGLARTIYNPRPGEHAGRLRDPAELSGLADRSAVEASLLDAFIPAAYRTSTKGRWTAAQAETWLVFLARHLEQTIRKPDLAWWQLRRSMPRTAAGAVVAVAAVLGVVTGIVVGLGFAAGIVAGGVLGVGVGVVLGIGFGIGVAVPLAAGLVGRSGAEAPARGVRVRAVVAGLARRTIAEALGRGVGVRSAWLVAGIVVGVVLVAEAVAGAGSAAGAVLAAGTGVAVAVVVVAVAGLEGVPGDLEEAASPRAVLAHDRRAALLLMLAAGVAAGYLVGVMAGAGAGAGVAAMAGAGVGIGLSARQTAWPSYLLTMGWLAFRHHLPWSLMSFLADAHRRGVLRQAGAVYQFRHIELQHWLVSRDVPEPVRHGTSSQPL